MKHAYLQQFYKLFITKVAAEDVCSQQQLLQRPYVRSCSGRKCRGQGKLKCYCTHVRSRSNCVRHCSSWVRCTHGYCCNSGNVPLMSLQGNVPVILNMYSGRRCFKLPAILN